MRWYVPVSSTWRIADQATGICLPSVVTTSDLEAIRVASLLEGYIDHDPCKSGNDHHGIDNQAFASQGEGRKVEASRKCHNR